MRTMIADADAAAVVSHVGRRWEDLRGARVFVSGGSGFVGTWLLATLCRANRLLGLDARVVVLSRDPAAFARSAPDLADDEAVELVAGDVRDFSWPAERFTHVIHAAASADAAVSEACPSDVRSTIIEGTRRIVELCRAKGVGRLLALSSGAVYRQPSVAGRRLREDDALGWDTLDDDRWVYHYAKRRMESMLATLGVDDAPTVSIGRLFSFVGPGLALDRHFAIGNFIADALSGEPVVVRGDGTPVRSYLYAADMAAWLWTILADGRPGRIYNVGSEHAVTIAQAARIVADAAVPSVEVRIEGTPASGGGGAWYVPSTLRARSELGVAEWTPLDDAVRRTISWHREGAR
jgi:nucleoside-diphosphate-sugar epimerase